MSSDSEVKSTLQLARTCASAALEAVRDAEKLTQTDHDIPLESRLKDFTSLLSLVYQHVTKLALALKPSGPTPRAAVSPLKDLAGHLDALGSCACSLDRGIHGDTIVREVRLSTEEVLVAVISLLRTYLSDEHYSRAGQGEGDSRGEQYLVRTGVTHEAIDRARSVPQSNKEAVKRLWEGIIGGVNDCLHEVEEILEEEEGSRDDKGEGSGEEVDDGWDELLGDSSAGQSKAATEVELARLKCAQRLFKLALALLKKIKIVLFSSSSAPLEVGIRDFDVLLVRAKALLKESDDLVHAVYVPQSSEAISRCLSLFTSSIKELRLIVHSAHIVELPRPNPASVGDEEERIEKGFSSMQLSEVSSETLPEGVRKERKWFDVCFEQIEQAARSMEP